MFAICFSVGLIVILCGCINFFGKLVVALLKYVVGPALVIIMIAWIVKYGL